MIAESAKLDDIFTNRCAYEIPVYQRQYEWDRSIWSSLANDFQSLHGKTGPKIIDGAYELGTRAEDVSHFVGAVVLYVYSKDNSDRIHIVDGQQRLTTMALMTMGMLNGIKRLIETGLVNLGTRTHIIEHLEELLLRNKKGVDKSKPETYFNRVELSTKDREEFRKVMKLALSDVADFNAFDEIENNQNDNKVSKIESCFRFFSDFFQLHLTHKIHLLADEEKYDYAFDIVSSAVKTLNTCFSFAVIKVNNGENPQEIFESLNARSKALSSFDLIKNSVLMEVNNASTHANLSDKRVIEVYDNHWKHFEENPFWDIDKRAPGTERWLDVVIDNKTVFLNYWLDANYWKPRSGINIITTGDDKVQIKDDVPTSKDLQVLIDKNSDIRFNTRDSIFWEYRSFLKSKAREDRSGNYLYEFSKALERDSKFYFQALDAIENNLIYKELDEEKYDVLFELSKTYDIRTLLSFIERVIIGLGYRALWKQIFWLIKARQKNQKGSYKIDYKEFNRYLAILDSWATRRYLYGFKITDLNIGTAEIMNHLAEREHETDSSNLDEFWPGKLLEDFLISKQDTIYLSWPTDHEIKEKMQNGDVARDHEQYKYILAVLEDRARGFTDFSQKEIKERPECERIKIDNVISQHILPAERRAKKWADALRLAEDIKPEELIERAKFQKSLGNIILIERPETRGKKVKKLPMHNNWDDRKKYIVESQKKYYIIINDSFVYKSDWNIDDIKERANVLMESISPIWDRPNK